MRISRKDWKEIFDLRDELEDEEDRRILRRFIRYVEYLEITLKKCGGM
jgi:hypothetical protein